MTLAGLLGWQGVLIYVFDVDKGAVGGVDRAPFSNNVVDNLVSGNITPVLSWILLVAVVGLFALLSILRTTRRRARGLSAPPLSITLLIVAAVAVAGIGLVWVCNLNLGADPRPGCALGHPRRFGHPRLPIHPAGPHQIRALHLRHRGQSGSRPSSPVSTSTSSGRSPSPSAVSPLGSPWSCTHLAWVPSLVGFDGGTCALYVVAAAVIGGASLFGGHGKPIHPLLGGLVIA